jgi:predicted NUDIX family NTP pyrophosphohydrolase
MDMSVTKRLSCGVIILNAERELLLCHVTRQHHWDLPKGISGVGESPHEAALRETQEETGLCFETAALIDLGRFEYRPRKDLHLFATLSPRLDVTTLRCTSHYFDLASGHRLPEMDDFGWFGFAQALRRCSLSMATVLSNKLDLDLLLARLLAQPGLQRLERRRLVASTGFDESR